jgi:CheY-like chemotaxis protein
MSQLLRVSVAKKVQLSFNLAHDLPRVRGDVSQIRQILMNLVINAGDAIAPRTDGVVRIATGTAAISEPRRGRSGEIAPGRYVWIEVADNGGGMDPQTTARVFDPFFSTKFTGRGLGLAAVDGIVRSAKGFIELVSAPGEGTTFRVFLPASAGVPEAVPAPLPAPAPRSTPAPLVLVVDDEEMVRRVAATMLRRHGYRVLEAADGKHALGLLENAAETPALAFVDLAMPVMGGDELAPVLAGRYPNLRIVLTSGFPEEDARQGVPPGLAHGFLQKPYTASGLSQKIAEVLGSEAS